MEKVRKQELLFGEAVDLIQLRFTDLFGQCKMEEMTRMQAERALAEGYAVNRYALGGLKKENESSTPMVPYIDEGSDELEVYLKPDPETCQCIPWEDGQGMVGSVICDVCNSDGTPFWADSRNVLKETIKRAERMGLDVSFDFQCEFYLFHTDDDGYPTTLTHEAAGFYDAGANDLAGSVRRDMLLSLSEVGIEVESAHHGLAPGQHSFRLPAQRGVKAGDCLQTFKAAVKRIAKSHGLYATFMPKPRTDGDGSGLYIGVTVRSPQGRTEEETAGCFCSGVRKHMRDMLIFTNPTVNSGKRLLEKRNNEFQPGFSVDAGFQHNNKTVRLVKTREGSHTVQVLFPDPSANPYLALAAILSAGLDGIQNPCTSEGEMERIVFPESLGVLLGELEENSFALKTFGDKLCRMYGEVKKEEWKRFCAFVTDWEVKEYLHRC